MLQKTIFPEKEKIGFKQCIRHHLKHYTQTHTHHCQGRKVEDLYEKMPFICLSITNPSQQSAQDAEGIVWALMASMSVCAPEPNLTSQLHGQTLCNFKPDP